MFILIKVFLDMHSGEVLTGNGMTSLSLETMLGSYQKYHTSATALSSNLSESAGWYRWSELGGWSPSRSPGEISSKSSVRIATWCMTVAVGWRHSARSFGESNSAGSPGQPPMRLFSMGWIEYSPKQELQANGTYPVVWGRMAYGTTY